MKRICFLITITLLFGMQGIASPVFSADEPFYAAPKVRPNVLIILDRSGSMSDAPDNTTPTKSCPTTAPYTLSTTGTYSKICIARTVLFDLLDANNDGSIDNTNDPTALSVRLGYSRFVNVPSTTATGTGEGTSPDYYNGNIKVVYDVGTSYAILFPTTATTTGDTLNDLTRADYTPLGTALSEALSYFKNASAVTSDGCKSCRKNYVILVTDGMDTVTCTAGSESLANRRTTVYAAKALYDAGIPVFVVGFGALPDALKYTLNWTAYYGYGGNDPNPADNSGAGTYTNTGSFCDAGPDDPGAQAKLGYAFLANNASTLASALQSIMGNIKQGSYTRSAPVLTTTGSRIYEGFYDLGASINWQGHLDAWDIDTDGTLKTSGSIAPCTSSAADVSGALGELYDAGRTLSYSTCGGYVAPADRKIYTNIGTDTIDFKAASSSPTAAQIDLCTALIKTTVACTNTETTSTAVGSANELINFIRFDSPTFNGSSGARNNAWHLGDIWHSTPTIVGPPLGKINNNAYNGFKTINANRTQILIVGSNDGMLHAFDDTNKGKEMWSFIPNNLLGKLKNLSTGHTFFVDASPTAADVCLQANCGTASEASADWETVVTSGERDGGNAYFALRLDGTTATTPKFKWQFTDANLGNTWSKPTIGKVRYNDGANTVDKWVTFFGGGVSSTADIGNYVYAVDISDGSLLGSGANITKKQVDSTNTANNVAAALRPVDLNGDYYVDAVYFGDTSGRMWRWDVSALANNNNGILTNYFDPGATHYHFNSAGNRVTEGAHTKRPIYYMPAITLDSKFRPIVVFGTGQIDELAATTPSTTTTDYVYAVRQEAGYTGAETDQSGVTELWRKELTAGERVLGSPVIFGGYVYFTTYNPSPSSGAATCTESGNIVSCDAGSGWLYIVDLETGKLIESLNLGSGIPSSPVIANGKVYTSTSNEVKPKASEAKQENAGAEVIYWRER